MKLPNACSRLRGPAARTQIICWLAISMMWPMPITVENSSSPAGDDHIAKPDAASRKITEPVQAVRASWPRSMMRPTRTAIRIGNIAKVAAIRPSQTIDRLSSTAR